MKRIVLMLILCFPAAGPSFAQNNAEAMKIMTVDTLMEYGQSLYERGNYSEATAVFNHVLTYDSHQVQALEYIKKMGHSPVVSSGPILQPEVSSPVDDSGIEGLKEAIEAKKQSIEKLRDQIAQLRASINENVYE